MMPEINLVLGKIAGFNLCAGIGLLSMVCLSMWQARQLKLDGHTTQFALESIPIVTLVAIIPACLSDIVFRWANFRANPLGFGMTFYGWLLGCVAGWRICESIAHLYPQFLLNFFAPSLALAQAFGRIGCFLAGCCHGRPVPPPMGVRFPEHSIPWERYGDIPLFPVQLMESAWLFSITLLLVLKVPFRHRFTAYLVLMGTGRFFMEFLRGDARGAVCGVGALSPAQFISAIIVVAGIVALLKHARKFSLSLPQGDLGGEGFRITNNPEQF
jgi:phosphatidylglycerol:prolipoprotein diacylglycerol transferase